MALAGEANAAGSVLSRWIIGLLIVAIQMIWMVVILREPLPNAAAVGGQVTRIGLLARALPEVVPGVRLGDSYLGQAVANLSTPGRLGDRLGIVAAAFAIAAAGLALGALLLRAAGRPLELAGPPRWACAYLLGTTVLSLLTLLLGRFGVLSRVVTWGLLGVLVALGVVVEVRWRWGRQGVMRGRGESRAGWLVWAPVGASALLLMALASLQPTIEYDALEYHLQGPKQWYVAGRVAFLPGNVYTAMPFGIEMLHLLGMHALGDWWRGALVGQFVVMLYAVAGGVLLGAAAARLGTPRAGRLAAILFWTTPWVYRVAATPFVEGPLMAYHAGLILVAILLWQGAEEQPPGAQTRARDSAPGPWLLLGLLAGGAMACKYPALVTAVVPFAVYGAGVSIRRRRWGPLLLYSAGVAWGVGPWLLKNAIDTGNPVFPLAYEWLGGRDWSEVLAARWQQAHGPRAASVAAAWSGLGDLLGRNDWQSPLYLAFAPLALMHRRARRGAVVLAAYGAIVFATWFFLTHRLDRFWLPIVPVLAILAGLGADWSAAWWWRWWSAGLIGLGIVTNLVVMSTELSGPNRWTASLEDLREETYRVMNPPLDRLDRELPENARVLLVGQAAAFSLRHEAITNTVFNEEILERIARGRSPEQIRRELARRGITHVYVDDSEIARHRRPGGYGYSPFITAELFDRLVAGGVLRFEGSMGPMHRLYAVVTEKPAESGGPASAALSGDPGA